ncbi:hypothetical protein IU436_29380 [Nocardia farcinica]|uniref:hypothetical protein n=1 Tax=Nocardia TaxID=1817 RepID=UPI001893E7D5|nr:MULTISPECIES: hypothetical protein [Nocardia]MBF6215821.1 hypothetical protein [Nocardia puris]MBF6422714.1 hypothetical protein [Nocardia farcinica]MBF6434436.1 hypothetical protein [Nocardia farcinica]MBF6505521.1 hypothetical protein [Nocardia farcinica]MBF6574152.1 hypothetical protein [Nocardia farcinica]
MELPAEWHEEIQRRLDDGMTPDAIANHFGRMVDDITLEEIAAVRDAAIDASRDKG